MAKSLQRIEARKLRKEKGLSIKEIAEKVRVGKSTVSLWCRDIESLPYK
jgi:transcriptional regulator with XRE-family HTH domain